ncbi:thyroglobulin [Xenopus tropicalis]|uniref:Thyroglobulin n=1 Tax=Xenopus tropicalis TaxID=8364 RepID=A0A193GMR8_XENTR|nr:thyroglobulin [Xenopus tropicalis]ANN81185.1 thyroglobulin [Xenopus tropicalis]|eukprot:NP_001316486.1 thyroglobulin [Xenopus tropicalis]
MAPVLLSTMPYRFIYTIFCVFRIIAAIETEYQLDSQPLRPCELARERALSNRESYVPQCSSEGLYRNIQCSGDGQTCWCVNANGAELAGSRQTDAPPVCLSFCQLAKQRILVSGYINSTSTSHIPQCKDSGEFEPVQCHRESGQCWCVDSEGMEIYGTRQTGKPSQCPRSCQVRGRRILHGFGEKTPPHCSADGTFQPIQCKLLNTTDKMAVDVVSSFSRFPETFESFSSLRESFPEISGYCYCADRLGRELAGTGLELLLDEVYDTVFSGLAPSRTFTETTVYRILQRRFLGVRLMTCGRFRCPSVCEVQRFTASQMGDIYVPSCDDNGDFNPIQCQTGQQCWCVDSKGREIHGTRRLGDSPSCNMDDCPTKRRQALSSLFNGPTGHFGKHSLFVTQEEELGSQINAKFCSSYLTELFGKSGLLFPIMQKVRFQLGSFVRDMVAGLFPSKELMQIALNFVRNPKNFQENLFGGKYLKNLGSFNFSGAVGTNSKFNFSGFFQQIGLTGMYSGGNFRELAKLFSAAEDSYLTKDSLNISKPVFNLNQPIQGDFGRIVNLRENQDLVGVFASVLELEEFALFLRNVISVPTNVAQSAAEAVQVVVQSNDCEKRSSEIYIPVCKEDGRYNDIQCSKTECWCVDDQGREIDRTRTQGKHPRCPTKCEKERYRQTVVRESLPPGAELFIPACDLEGHFLTVQCTGKLCFCVDLEGRIIPGTQKVSGDDIQCPSLCQLAAGNAFLQSTMSFLAEPELVQLSDVYVPQCAHDGKWKPVQCNGPAEQVFELYELWTKQNKNITLSETFNIIQRYKRTSAQSFPTFVKELYNNGHQKVFPIFSSYNTFNNVPAELLSGDLTSPSDNILLNPFVFWRLLNGSLTFYPGPYTAFSQPLSHFELRNCWCVDLEGQKLEQKEVSKNEVPQCPTSCELAKLRAMKFIKEAEDLSAISNISHFPWGLSFLIANGIELTERELLHPEGFFRSGEPFFERFRDRGDYAVHLAAQSTLRFHWQQRSSLERSSGEVSRVAYRPYVPQCDGLGNWEPVQYYGSTGHNWCVDADGNYIAGSLEGRTSRPRQCQTRCQQDQTNMVVSSWLPQTWSPQSGPVDMVVPGCMENGQFSALQTSESQFWCVAPSSGQVIQHGKTDIPSNNECPGYCSVLKSEVQGRNVGFPFVPECGENGDFSSTQCDQDGTMCFCVFPDGEEAFGTRQNVSEMGKPPTCKSPICPLAFSAQDIRHGAVFCENILEAGITFQKCQLVCRKGYQNVLLQDTFTCNTDTRLWGVQVPHPGSCQKIQSFQSIETQAQFQLLLPVGKKCMAEYSGLLQAFRTFILDDLRARGLCQIQVNYFGSRGAGAVSVCDESTVFVECLAVDRLGVNVTWRTQLDDFPESFMPSLHDIEDALIGDNLVGRFASVISSGNYSLTLDSKEFVADRSVLFPHMEKLGSFPQTSLGCAQGFLKSLNSKTGQFNGCVICPAGSFAQNEVCKLCPLGFYQVEPGTASCTKCPLGTTTVNGGAYNRSHCVTSCQRNSIGLLCDANGQYQPSQKDVATNRYFCVDVFGKRLIWSETDTELTDAQCLLLRKFELVPEDKILFIGEDSGVTQPKANGQIKSLLDCVTDCGTEESCDYISVSTNGSGLICEQYSANESNIVCTDVQQKESVLGNTDSVKVENPKCQMKIRQRNTGSHTVYGKKGYTFLRSGQALFERTGFGNIISGAYKTLVFSADGASLSEAHLFCHQVCRKDPCCDGFILSQIILNKGTILCGLLSSPDVLLCNVNDWSGTSLLGGEGVCKGVRSNKEQKMFSFFLGGQEFTGSYSMLSESIGKVEYTTELTAEVKEEIQQLFVTFQRVFLKRDGSGNGLSDCSAGSVQELNNSSISDSVLDLFLPVESNTVTTDPHLIISSQQYGVSRLRYSSDQALRWCLTRCKEEGSWCLLTDLQETTEEFFTCTLYPDAWKCSNSPSLTPDDCKITLHNKPQRLYLKKDMLGNTVKNFYSVLPFRQITDVSVRRKIDMTGKSISNGFFECELHCDADPCCKGFGYLQTTHGPGTETRCLLLSSMGIQSCMDTPGNQWRVLNCSSSIEGRGTHPFGWFQKPDNQRSPPSSLCPPVDVLKIKQEDLGDWLLLDKSSAVIDPSLSAYDMVQISRESPDNLQAAQNYCLAVCARAPSCVTATVALQEAAVRCLFYPDNQNCFYGLRNHQCQLLVKEPATFIFRRKVRPPPSTSVAIPQGTLLGKSEAVVIGSNIKNVVQFLGIPYAAPPVGVYRFSPPQPVNWTGEWNATYSRASCLQPGDGKAQYSSVGEDCLYLNVFVPQHAGTNAAVLLYFHNSPSDYSEKGQTFIDGSYLAAIGNIVVVTAGYRVGVFGFLSNTGETAPSGNWGLLDQVAALKWVQENIAYFGGDPTLISIAADRAGADISSIHTIVPEGKLFRRALLMGGSAFSPMMVTSEKRAKEQVEFLAAEVECSSSNKDLLTCLRGVDAGALNAAQTKLLAQRGPFQTWGPIVDKLYVKETPSRMLKQKKFQKIDLLIGSSELDGLISRAKAIKRFEETQGRVDKTAFYQALQNSLGGVEANSLLQEAAVWFYSLEHSSDDYTGFSKALEKATRDHFIACPVIKMAKHWAENSKGNIYLYHVPDTLSQSSSGLDLPEDVIRAFGLPFHTNYKNQFSSEEQILSLKIMQYVSNFVRTGNPNFPYKFLRRISKELPAWPMYLAHSNGTNYKEFSSSLTNNQGLKNSECSFWNDYIPTLKVSTGLKSDFLPTEKTPESKLLPSLTPASPEQDKEGYNRRK